MLFLSFFHVACMATLTMQLVVWFCTLREDFGYTVLTLVHIFCCYFLIFCLLTLVMRFVLWFCTLRGEFGYTVFILTLAIQVVL